MTVSTRELCRAAGISERQVRYWIGWGIITPTVQGTPGGDHSGHRWDADDVRVVQVVAQLLSLCRHGDPRQPRGEAGCRPFHQVCDWRQLDRHIRSHHGPGWAVIATDGRIAVTADPEHACWLQQSAACSILIPLPDATPRVSGTAGPAAEHGPGPAHPRPTDADSGGRP